MMRHHVRIAAGGRIVIPARLRKELGLRTGDPVILDVEDGALRVRSLDAAIARAQELVAQYVPADVSLADELIRERREEAARELHEAPKPEPERG
jgi:AbrB family looped-hinge helix DNA binding protein